MAKSVETYGFIEFVKLMRGFDKRLKKVMPQAMKRIGLTFERSAVKKINAGEYEENAPLTIALKGSSKPLVDHGDLVGSITHRVVDGLTVMLGIKSPKLRGGRLLYDVLHEGATIKVTPAMRVAVMAKLQESTAKGATSGAQNKHREWMEDALDAFSAFQGSGAAFWIIPPRPFLSAVWEDKAWQDGAQKILDKALAAALAPPKRGKSK